MQEGEIVNKKKIADMQTKLCAEKQQQDIEKEFTEKERRTQENEVAKKILNQQLQEKVETNKQKRKAEEDFYHGVQQKVILSVIP